MTHPAVLKSLASERNILRAINADLIAALKAAIPFLEAAQREVDYEVAPLTRARATLGKAKEIEP